MGWWRAMVTRFILAYSAFRLLAGKSVAGAYAPLGNHPLRDRLRESLCRRRFSGYMKRLPVRERYRLPELFRQHIEPHFRRVQFEFACREYEVVVGSCQIQRGLSEDAGSFVVLWKSKLKPLNSRAPLRLGWLAYRVLISEKPNLLNGFADWNGFKPLNAHKILAGVRVTFRGLVVTGSLGNIKNGEFAGRGLQFEC